MRRRSAYALASWALAAAWIGCNAILGNESAVFDPGAGSSSGLPSDGSPGEDDGGGEGNDSGDGGPDSDVEPCTGTNLDSPRHCGRCNHDCLGGQCIGRRCQPFPVVAETTGRPIAVTVDDTHVYWNTYDGSIWRAPKSGGAPMNVFTGGAETGKQIAVHGGFVYFPHVAEGEGKIARCATTGCDGEPGTVIATVSPPDFLRIDGDTLLWVELAPNGRICRCLLPGCQFLEILATDIVWPLRATASTDLVLYSTLTNPTGLFLRSPGAAQSVQLSDQPARSVELRGDEVLFASFGTGMNAILVDGGAQRLLHGQTIPNVEYFALGGDDIFFTETRTSGRVLQCHVAGCTDAGVLVLAADQNAPRGLALDETSVYWANEGSLTDTTGSIMRVVR
jgi:hypothetical protein